MIFPDLLEQTIVGNLATWIFVQDCPEVDKAVAVKRIPTHEIGVLTFSVKRRRTHGCNLCIFEPIKVPSHSSLTPLARPDFGSDIFVGRLRCCFEKPLTAAVSSPPPKFQTRRPQRAPLERQREQKQEHYLAITPWGALMTFRNRILRAATFSSDQSEIR